MLKQKKLNMIEKLKNCLESFRMSKDKELKCKQNLRMLTLNGHVNFKYSLLIWKAKVKKQKMTFCKSMNCFSKWLQFAISKKVYCSRDKTYCLKTLSCQSKCLKKWTWLIWCDFRVREISRSREKWKIRYCQVQKFGEKFGKNSK